MNKRKKLPSPKKRSSPYSHVITLLTAIAVGTVCGLLSALILSFASSLICIRSNDPISLTRYFSVGVLGISYLIGGFAASKKARDTALLSSLLTAASVMLILFLAGIFLPSSDKLPLILSLTVRIVAIIMSVFGGYIASQTSSKPRRHTKR